MKDYIERVIRTEGPGQYDGMSRRLDSLEVKRVLHASLGITTEAAEISDIVKKFLMYGKGHLFDERIQEEIGDLLWYIAILCDVSGLSIENVMKWNIEKLEKRYPNGFSEESAVNRMDKNNGK